MIDPIDRMQIDLRGWEFEFLAAMCAGISAFTINTLGTGCGGNLFVPADVGVHGGGDEFGSEMIGGRTLDDLAGGIAIGGFNSPADGGFVDLWHIVQQVE